jgi:hypothetical protein
VGAGPGQAYDQHPAQPAAASPPPAPIQQVFVVIFIRDI